MGGRGELPMQGTLAGGEIPLAQVRIRDQICAALSKAVEDGEDYEKARSRIEEEANIERLSAAFGGAEVVKVDPDSFGGPK